VHAFGACTPIRCYVVPCCFLLARARAERSCTQGAVTCLSAAVPGAFRRVLGCHHEERSEAGSPMGAVQRPLGCRRGICFWLSGGCPILRAVREGWVRARLWRVHADRCPSHLAAAALVAQGAATCFSVAGPGAFLRVFGVITRSQRRGICFCLFGCRTLRFQGCGFFHPQQSSASARQPFPCLSCARAKGVHEPTLNYEGWGTRNRSSAHRTSQPQPL